LYGAETLQILHLGKQTAVLALDKKRDQRYGMDVSGRLDLLKLRQAGGTESFAVPFCAAEPMVQHRNGRQFCPTALYQEGEKMNVYDRLKELGVGLPQSTPPAAAYCPGVKAGDFVFTAGQTPKVNGVLQYRGKCGTDLTLEDAQKAARMCAVNCLAIVNRLCGLDKVVRVVKVTGFVNCAADFTKQSQVVDGASKLLYDLFGEAGAHARSAVGMSSLPGNAACEVEMIFQVKE
jgi:enamine deaminase RidA (YjgF/YER057c/UK114 family)